MKKSRQLSALEILYLKVTLNVLFDFLQIFITFYVSYGANSVGLFFWGVFFPIKQLYENYGVEVLTFINCVPK